MVITAALAALLLLRPTPPTAPKGSDEVLTVSTKTPSEVVPGADYLWKGAADDPQRIIAPTIGVNGYIQKVGIDQESKIAVPDNVHVAGWFVDSVRPGDKGLSIIDGHVDGPTMDAIFVRLGELQQGDRFSIMRGDNVEHVFEVVKTVTILETEAAPVLYSQHEGVTRQLNLITCGGTFDTTSNTYDKRTIVIATLV